MAMTKPKSSQIEHRGETVQKVIDDITQEDGVLVSTPDWTDVPKLKGANANKQAQALVNRTKFLQETRAALEDFGTAAQAYAFSGRVSVRSNLTVLIPGDAPTLQAAIDKFIPEVGVKITLLIEAGHALTDGCHVSHGDFSGFIIKAEDAIVKTAPNFPDAKSIVYAEYAIAPTLECKVDMEMRGCSGYYLKYSSTGFVKPGCGVDNPGGKGVPSLTGIGLFVWGASKVWADGAIFRGAIRNLWVTHESVAYCDHGNFDAARGTTGIYIARSSIAGMSYGSAKNCQENAVMVRRARLTAMCSDFSNAGLGGAGSAVVAREGSVVNISQGSELDKLGANLSGAANNAIDCDGSFVNAFSTNMDGAGGATINALNGALVLVNDSSLKNSPRAIAASTGSTVVAPRIVTQNQTLDAIRANGAKVIINDANISSTPNAIIASNGGEVIANGAKISMCSSTGVNASSARVDITSAEINQAGIGVQADSLSTISGRYAKITNSTQYGIYSLYGSQVLIRQGQVTGSGTQDLRVQKGGQIHAASASTTDGPGAPSLSNTNVTAFNQWTGNGVIFD